MANNKNLKFELKLEVIKASISGGGLPHNSYVEILVGEEVVDTSPTLPPPHEWRHQFIKHFSDLEPSVPIYLSFAVYKKKWTAHGFKLVGTVRFPLSDLFPHLNKGPFQTEYQLAAPKKNITMGGKIFLTIDLKEIKTLPETVQTDELQVTSLVPKRLPLLKFLDFDNSKIGLHLTFVVIVIIFLVLLVENWRWSCFDSKTKIIEDKIKNLNSDLDKIMLKLLL